MSDIQYKQSKLSNLRDEVKQFHPFLENLLPRLPNVSAVEYTHGPSEKGADFVLQKEDQLLGGHEYVGIIVKSGDIRQNHDDIERQIKECSLPRYFDGGKKKITISEIWVMNNGSISENAKDKIHHEYRDKKIKFVWLDKLVDLTDKYFPEWWVNINTNIALYLSSVERSLRDMNERSGLGDFSIGDFYVEQDLFRNELKSKKRFSLKSKRSTVKLSSLILKERFMLIEGGMGYGKSRLLRQAAIELSQRSTFQEKQIIPVFITFRDLVLKFSSSLNAVLTQLRVDSKLEVDDYEIIFFIDGVDEIRMDLIDKAKTVRDFVSQLMPFEQLRVVFSSRPFEDPLSEEILDEAVIRYQVLPLSIQKIVAFVEKICDKAVLTSRFKGDLQKSDLFRSLPRTPISAILLARVLSSNVKELPSTLPELYSKYLDLALGRWELKKGGGSEKEYETIVIITRIFARYLLENDFPDIGIGDAREMVRDYLSKRETGQDLDVLFSKILSCSEIICIDELKNRLFFRHRTFLEYMYAEHLFALRGASAEIEYPFDIYWGNVNYFYLGKLKDCPSQLHSIFFRDTSEEADVMGKIFQSGNYLLAAYQSPYDQITDCVKSTILDAAKLYCDICNSPKDSRLGHLSELHLLAIMTGLMRHAFEYDFFKRALVNTETDILLSVEQDKIFMIAAFFVAAIQAGLGNREAFSELVTDHLAILPTAVRLGVTHASRDAEISNIAIKKLEKKLNNARKGNPGYSNSVKLLYDTPLNKRDVINNH